MTATSPPTNIQGWLRDYSKQLENSFLSSGRLQHAVTKGESREHQVLDILTNLLPAKASVETNVVIIDSADIQSPKFDGGLVDRALWPRIFADGNTVVVMIESVLAAIEIKSLLNKSEIDDIFKKSAKLRAMTSGTTRPLVTAFAYQSSNSNLSFFDFATSFYRSPEGSPSSICILNKHLFALARIVGRTLISEDEPSKSAIPVLYTPDEDTLLLYVLFLSQWVTTGTNVAAPFMRYSQTVFSRMTAFHFDLDFLDAVKSNRSLLDSARQEFAGKPGEDINKLYAVARKRINLS